MKCRIKKIKKKEDIGMKDIYFREFISINKVISKYTLKPVELSNCCWTDDKQNAKVFNDGRKVRGLIKKYKLKNVEIEYEEDKK